MNRGIDYCFLKNTVADSNLSIKKMGERQLLVSSFISRKGEVLLKGTAVGILTESIPRVLLDCGLTSRAKAWFLQNAAAAVLSVP